MSTLRITTPSRLHFGMFSFGQPDVRQFGGVGAMIDRPGLELTITAADRFEVAGLMADRTLAFAQQVIKSGLVDQHPRCRIEVVSAPRQHVGLGVGTQLGMAVAAGLNGWCGGPSRSAMQLAQAAGRGARSSIGLYGFVQGGLLIDSGKRPGENSPPPLRVELPGEWRFVLLTPREKAGLSGEDESRAFEALPPVPVETTAALCHEALLHLVPAAAAGDFREFSESLYRFGHLAGLCFAARQGGAFSSQQAAELVDLLRAEGVRGVAQSSWGPLLCALFPGQNEAESFVRQFSQHPAAQRLEISVAAPNNTGALITAMPD